jgi:hypothetical protein
VQTEKDFADIAAAGLNFVRIPIGFWAIDAINDEPFLVGTSWKYFLKACVNQISFWRMTDRSQYWMGEKVWNQDLPRSTFSSR